MHPETKILIVDDHPVFRKGLAQLIEEEPDMTVCGEAASVAAAMREIEAKSPHMAIVDLSLEDTSGMELIRHIHDRVNHMPVLVVSMHDESVYAERVLRAGALGYINKQEMTYNVIQAIRQVMAGRIYASASMVETLLGKLIYKTSKVPDNPVEALSNRELEVFQLIGKGFGRREIADMLHLSVKTIGAYREHIKKKLNLKNSTELLTHAIVWVEGRV